LNTVGQKEKESLTQFLTRWRDEVDKVEEMDDKTAMSLLMNAFRSGDLYTEFCRRPPSSYQEAYNTAWEYADAEALNKSKRELEEGYTKGEQSKRPWTEKWCTYHQSDSHNTEDCRNVKAVLKEMALKGELGEGYATGNMKDLKANTWTRPQGKDQGRRKSGKDNNNPDKEFIEMIVGGPEGGTLPPSGRTGPGAYTSVLRPLQTPLSSFTRASIEAEGQITLPVTLGLGNRTVTNPMRFVVVDIKCVHNAILGRPGINQ
ncbi:unnamed protein product, partial [Cuscuta campestris]